MADDDSSDSGSELSPPNSSEVSDSAPQGPPEDSRSGKDEDARQSDADGKDRADKDNKNAEQERREQERREQFARATSDPLKEALGGPSARAGEGQAYRSWVRTVRASGAAFVSGGSIGVLNIGTSAGSTGRGIQAPGPLRQEVLEEIAIRYVPVPGYEQLVQQLERNHVLVLRGAPCTGRSTTGLRMLYKLTERVARFSPDTDLCSIASGELQAESGYLLELAARLGKRLPSPAEVDLLTAKLAENGSYLVLVAQHDVRHAGVFAGYLADCPLPDPGQVFDRAVDAEIRRRPDLAETLRRAAPGARPHGSAGPQTPAEVTWLTAYLASGGPADLPAATLDQVSNELASRYVSAWFEPLSALPVTAEADEAVRLASFRIALSVLNDSPYDLVAEAAEQLAAMILRARSPRRQPGRPVFAHDRHDYVRNSRAKMTAGQVRFISANAPATLVSFEDDRLPVAVLRHVWSVHNLRDPLLSWLELLSEDLRPLIYMRAALALGLLTSWDFSYTFHERIEPWASSTGRVRQRWVAAVALDEASRNDDVRPVVREMLESWCEKGEFPERWTAAIALGYDIGLRDPAKALSELRKLVCSEKHADDLLAPTSWAVFRIFVLGGIKPVITALKTWLDDSRRAVRQLALVTVLRIADVRVNELEILLELSSAETGFQWSRLADRPRWPMLVAVAEEDPALLDPLADLVWHLTRSGVDEPEIVKILARWMRAGEKDARCVGPVGKFLALLGDDEADRARLLHIVDGLSRNRDEPLPAGIAYRYWRAIESNIHVRYEAGE
jgi:hypothetical protein